MTDFNAKRSGRRSDVLLILWGLAASVAGGLNVRANTNRTSVDS
jgi:hypothetical protein